MGGLYIHIPFCKKACHYCNFHFSTTLKQFDEVMSCILLELAERKHEMNGTLIGSVYFGGGTPSLIPKEWLEKIFNQLYKHYSIESDAEITLEANPDDVKTEHLLNWKNLPINRFSLGVQSFFDEDLALMNRAHNANEADYCIKLIQDTGFDKISIDLMYGLPGLSNTKWLSNLQRFNSYHLNHLSAYCLTLEEKTALAHFTKKGSIALADEETAAEQFELMLDFLTANQFEQYEISNFARLGAYAKHNTAYWQNKPYLGFGPSAHSFNGIERRWNIANNLKYVNLIQHRKPYFETEILTLQNKMNEYIMTSTRTIWGCNLIYFEEKFGSNSAKQLLDKAIKLNRLDEIIIENNTIKLSQKGKLLADEIASLLFF